MEITTFAYISCPAIPQRRSRLYSMGLARPRSCYLHVRCRQKRSDWWGHSFAYSDWATACQLKNEQYVHPLTYLTSVGTLIVEPFPNSPLLTVPTWPRPHSPCSRNLQDSCRLSLCGIGPSKVDVRIPQSALSTPQFFIRPRG